MSDRDYVDDGDEYHVMMTMMMLGDRMSDGDDDVNCPCCYYCWSDGASHHVTSSCSWPGRVADAADVAVAVDDGGGDDVMRLYHARTSHHRHP